MNIVNRTVNIVKSAAISILIILLIGPINGCSTAKPATSAAAKRFTGNRIAVLPVKNMARIYGAHKSVLSPISGTYFMTGRVMENAEGLLTDNLTSRLKNRSDIVFIPSKQANDTLAAILSGDNIKNDEKRQLAAIGRSLKADAVLVGYVYKFRQRSGNQHSVNAAASIAFEFYLINVSDASVLWSGSFKETQQSLSEDLFKIKTFIKRKGRWITAEEMASDGLEEMLKDFPTK